MPLDDRTQPDTGPEPATRLAGLAAVGEVIGGYRVEGRAGSGGMAVVFRAHDPELDRPIALKLIVPEYARDRAWRDRFLDESRAIAALDHPHVVPVHARGEDQGRLFIAMRYVGGGTVAERLRTHGALPAGDALTVVDAVAAALDAAHARGIVHGDVKPGNVLLGGDDQRHVYLSDFGLVARGRPTPGVMQGVGWAGTPGYAAPELIRGDGASPATDVYALACMLFEVLTGRPPFVGDRETVLADHLAAPPPALTAHAPGLPQQLDEVMRAGLAKRPEDRPSSAGALARAARAATHALVLMHDPADTDATRTVAATLKADGLAVVTADTTPTVTRGTRNAVDLARAAAVMLGSATPQPPPTATRVAAVLLPGAPEAATDHAHRAGLHPVIDLRAGLDDADGLRRLLALGGLDTLSPRAIVDGCPYRGLATFEEADAPVFVGREQDTDALLSMIATNAVVFVVGPSGSGKSSLVRAGVVPRVRRAGLPGAGTWHIDVRSPSTGFNARDIALLPADGRLVVLDQFEEIFAPDTPADERDAVAAAVARAASAGPRLRVVCIMRSDFMGACARIPELARPLAHAAYPVGPLSPAAVRRVVEEPATTAGLALEPGLARRIVDDVAERPGALPLLSHLLLELWRMRRGRTLTLAGYAASGGVGGALSRRANEVMHALPPPDREAARNVLLRLVQPGEGTEDTRRRVVDAELTGAGTPEQVERVVKAFSRARLIAVGAVDGGRTRTVEVAHEALIRGWSVLREWVDTDRDRLRAERRLTAAARDWADGGHREDGLYRGATLADWDERAPEGLTDQEQRFLRASRGAAQRQALRARRRRQALTGIGLAAIAVLGVSSALAWWQRGVARTERDRATAQVQVLRARELLASDPAAALVVARGAVAARDPSALDTLRRAVNTSPELAAVRVGTTQLSAVAPDGTGGVVAGDWRGRIVRWTPEDGRVQTVRAAGAAVQTLAAGPGWLVALDETGDVFVAGADGPPGGTLPVADVRSFGRSADGTRLAVCDARSRVTVLDTATWRPVTRLTVPGVTRVALAADGDLLLAGDGWLERRDGGRNGRTTRVRHPAGAPRTLTDRGDGTVLATAGSSDDTVAIVRWTGRTVRVEPVDPAALPLAAGGSGVEMTNDVRRDAIAVRLGLSRTPQLLPQSGEAAAAVIMPGGRIAVTAHADGTLHRWSLEGLPRVVSRAPAGGGAVAIDADARRMAVTDAGRRVGVTPVAGGPITWDGPADGVTMSGDGLRVARLVGAAVTVRTDTGERRFPVRRLNDAALNDDGSALALVDDGRLRVHRTGTGRLIGATRPSDRLVANVVFIPGTDDVVASLYDPSGASSVGIARFSSGSRTLTPLFGAPSWASDLDAAVGARVVAVASETGKSVMVWDAATGRTRVVASTGRPMGAVALSPDGRLVAAGGTDGRVGVWATDGSWGLPGVITAGGPVRAVRVGDTGLVTAAAADGTVRRWRCRACDDAATVLQDATTRVMDDRPAADRAAALSP